MPGPDRRTGRALGVVVAVCALIVGACSSDGSDDATDAGGDVVVEAESGGDQPAATTEPSDSGSGDVDTADVDCAALEEAVGSIRGVGPQMLVLEEPDALALVLEPATVEDVQAGIAVLRPYQDIEGESFGSMRAGLDNLEADLAAYSEGRWDDRVGGYPLLEVVEVFNELGCG